MVKWIRDSVLLSLITLVTIEIALRVVPSVIPLGLLIHFAPQARTEIAERRNLATQRRTIEVPRDDDGPPIRVFPPHRQVSRVFSDPDAVDDVTTDETGFCNVPLDNGAERAVGFVAVGDSFTWCTGVHPEDAWVSRLAQSTGVGGYNLGLGGVGVYEYLQILAAYGLQWRPRVVLLNYYEGNDLRDALGYRRHVERRDRDQEDGKPLGVMGKTEQAVRRVFDAAFVGRSYALNLALASSVEIHDAIKTWRGEELINFRYQVGFRSDRVRFNLENTDTEEVEHARALREGRISLSVLEEGLERFVELSEQHGFDAVVLYTPSAYTAYTDFVEFEDPDLGQLMPWFSRAQRDFLRSKSETLGYRFVDLTPALRRAAREYQGKALLYFPTNLHLSQSGNQVVAQELARVLALEVPPGDAERIARDADPSPRLGASRRSMRSPSTSNAEE